MLSTVPTPVTHIKVSLTTGIYDVLINPFAKIPATEHTPQKKVKGGHENTPFSSGFTGGCTFNVDCSFQSIQQWNNQWNDSRCLGRGNTERLYYGNKQRYRR